MNVRLLGFAAVIHCCVSAASAAVISANDPVFGTGALTRDTSQGLDFLDVPFSLGRSIDDVSTEFGVGGDFAGFRYATDVEVISLVNNYGFSPAVTTTGVITGNTGADQLSGLVSLLGSTSSATDRYYTYGTTATASIFPGTNKAVVLADFFNPLQNDAIVNDSVLTSFVGSYIGSYLVRSSPTNPNPPTQQVPEPASIPLLGTNLGFLFVCWLRCRSRRKPLPPD